MRSLRSYQERDVGEVRQRFGRGVRRVCYQAPTGSGKTVLFAFIVAGAMARGNKVVIIGHRDEIVRQISAALVELGVAPAPVQIANIATLVRRLDQLEHRQALHWAGDDANRLHRVAVARGYKRGWVRHVLRERAAS